MNFDVRQLKEESYGLLPSHKQVHGLLGAQHLSGALGPRHRGQSLQVEAGVQAGAAPAGHALGAACPQCVTQLAVEVRVRGQGVEDQVVDPLDRVS